MFPLQCPAQFSVKVAMGIRTWCQNTLKHYSRQLFSFQDVNASIPPPHWKSPWQELDQGNKHSLFMCTHSVHFTLLSKPIAFSCSNNKCIKPEEEPVKNAACVGTGSLWLAVLGHCRSWGAKWAVVGRLEDGRVQNAPRIRGEFQLLQGLWS